MVIVCEVSEAIEAQAAPTGFWCYDLHASYWATVEEDSTSTLHSPPLLVCTLHYNTQIQTQTHNMTQSTVFVNKDLFTNVCICKITTLKGECSWKDSYLLRHYCIISLFTQFILTCWEWCGCRRWVYPCRSTWLAVVKRNQIRVYHHLSGFVLNPRQIPIYQLSRIYSHCSTIT